MGLVGIENGSTGSEIAPEEASVVKRDDAGENRKG
jgi:hypothetical protein